MTPRSPRLALFALTFLVACATPTLGAEVGTREEHVVEPEGEELDCPASPLADQRAPVVLLAPHDRCDLDTERYCFSLAAALREVAARRDPLAALEAAARAADTYLATGDDDARLRALALADLSVTGAESYTQFAAVRPDGAMLHASPTAEALVLTRAYDVAWALRGPPAHRARARAALGWVAVSPEDDPPSRPVNQLAGPWRQHDVTIQVPLDDGQSRAVRARVGIASTLVSEQIDGGDGVEARVGVVPDEGAPVLPAQGDLLLFIHGHTSLAEEGASLIEALLDHARGSERALTVLAVDLPSNGYSERIDPEEILGARDASAGEDVLLRFQDAFLVALVETLGVGERLQAVLGGSLGGNLVLRLAEADRPWPRAFVAWSPASIDHSWALARMPFTAGPGEYTDVVKHEAVRLTRELAATPEDPGSRGAYFVGGLSSIRSQSAYWYRPDWQPCSARHVDAGLAQVGETYDDRLRRWHYRVAYEQLVFSHLDPASDTGLRPYERMRAPLLLLAGDADDAIPMSTYTHVGRLSRLLEVEGPTLLLARTGHAMHTERPALLAREIAAFLEGR